MNNNEVTLQDCIDNYDKKDKYAVIRNGKLIGFVKEGKQSERDSEKT